MPKKARLEKFTVTLRQITLQAADVSGSPQTFATYFGFIAIRRAEPLLPQLPRKIERLIMIQVVLQPVNPHFRHFS